MSYNIFSHFYDIVMDQTVYDQWLSFVEGYRQRHHQSKEQLAILELACGTGIIALKLAEAGHDVTGYDLSADMLSLAQERIEEAGQEIQLIEGDMRELPDIQAFDMVTCFSDSLCYLHQESDLLQVFEGVHRNLSEGGTFLFDVHSLFQMDHVFPGYQYIYQEESEVFLWESFIGDYDHSVEHVLTFFVENEDGRFDRLQEIHQERSFPLETYQRLLKEAGFSSVELTAEFGESPVDETTTRWFFAAKK